MTYLYRLFSVANRRYGYNKNRKDNIQIEDIDERLDQLKAYTDPSLKNQGMIDLTWPVKN